MTKTCTKCFADQPVSEFHNSKTTKDGLQYRCKSCFKKWHKGRWTPEESRKVRERDLKRLCNIDLELFEFVLQEQGGVCKICNQVESHKWHADHDHVTGKFRAVLCGNCNRGLGQFKDNAMNLINAAKYLSL